MSTEVDVPKTDEQIYKETLKKIVGEVSMEFLAENRSLILTEAKKRLKEKLAAQE